MASIRSTDTKPELIVRRHLYARGYRYRKNFRRLPGTPDIVLRKYRTVIFIHGCFWHGHETHFHLPKSNRSFWEEKIQRNRQRDIKNRERLRAMSWNVITVWECALAPATVKRTLMEIEALLNKIYLEQFKPHSPAEYAYESPAATLAAESAPGYDRS